LSLLAWLAALDDFRNWLIREAASTGLLSKSFARVSFVELERGR